MNSFKRDIYKTILHTNNEISCNDGMDVLFIVDYTASMGGEIDDVKVGIESIVDTIKTKSGEDYRLSLLLADEYSSGTISNYSDKASYTTLPENQKIVNTGQGGNYQWITCMEQFSDNNAEGTNSSFIVQLNKLNNTNSFPLGSGGNFPEPSDLALRFALEPSTSDLVGTFRNNVAKYVIIMTDDNPSGDDDLDDMSDISEIVNLINLCKDEKIKVIALGAGVDKTINGVYPWRELANQTGGTFNANLNATNIQEEINNNCS